MVRRKSFRYVISLLLLLSNKCIDENVIFIEVMLYFLEKYVSFQKIRDQGSIGRFYLQDFSSNDYNFSRLLYFMSFDQGH